MSEAVYHAVLTGAGTIYGIAAMLTLVRLLAGPNSLDRLISLESLIAMVQGLLALLIAGSLNTSWAYPMLVVALLGFISSVAVARFRVPDKKGT
ncbi:cation:proton antiporter [Corynebacterium sp. TAE3-ERU12]|uniref:monovalent cation/H+ antiporter complex subunit F n=1 Tax=Corynebacterium sp. TAE3-ERU12 TaxID=2849491 RepID=UPI001C4803A3|nr:monovalent cation/H+ antiporter complex subunit F [Corynebacterium sp. TAE3-ERU12]MBV7295959.1 cation:proton antiporter [Corynebacterium sp. TAE3-ERU12]